MTDFKAKLHQILRLNCTKLHQFDFGWGSALDPTKGAYSAPQTPQLDFGATSRQGRGWAGQEEGGEGKGGGSGGEGKEGPKLLLNHGPSRALLRH